MDKKPLIQMSFSRVRRVVPEDFPYIDDQCSSKKKMKDGDWDLKRSGIITNGGHILAVVIGRDRKLTEAQTFPEERMKDKLFRYYTDMSHELALVWFDDNFTPDPYEYFQLTGRMAGDGWSPHSLLWAKPNGDTVKVKYLKRFMNYDKDWYHAWHATLGMGTDCGIVFPDGE